MLEVLCKSVVVPFFVVVGACTCTLCGLREMSAVSFAQQLEMSLSQFSEYPVRQQQSLFQVTVNGVGLVPSIQLLLVCLAFISLNNP